MLIGQLAQQSGFSRDTIRYYEKIGLVSLPKRSRRDNNYKEYTVAILTRLQAVKRLKAFGYTLIEIRDILASYQQGQLDCLKGQDQIARKVALIDQQIEQLTQLRQQLLTAVADCPDQCQIMGLLAATIGCQGPSSSLVS